jgi:signal transduction histidine kinase
MNDGQTTQGDILIVDDTPSSLRLLSTMLIQQGYEVRSVTSGANALMGIPGQKPDLILLDIQMPEMNGYEVCEFLKAGSNTCDIPIIFISALNEAFDKVKAFAVGGVDYITKPFQVEEVLARVAHHLILRKLQTQLQVRNAQLQQAETDLLRSLAQERSLNQQIEALAVLEERHRIARDLHDSLGHSLVALKLQAESALVMWHEQPDKAYQFIVAVKQLSAEALQAIRESVTEMRSDPLQGQLLEAAIATLLQEFHRMTGVLPTSVVDLSQPLSNSIHTVVYRMVQEGLTNIAKHANATLVQLHIQTDSASLSLILEDNGKGFNVDESVTGFGLQGMQERAIEVGGQLEILSQPGVGCRITASFPRVT